MVEPLIVPGQTLSDGCKPMLMNQSRGGRMWLRKPLVWAATVGSAPTGSDLLQACDKLTVGFEKSDLAQLSLEVIA